MKKNLFAIFVFLLLCIFVSCDSKPYIYTHEMVMKFNDDGHWEECICGDKTEIVPHSYDELVVIDGKSYGKCICGKTIEAETISSIDDWQTAINTGKPIYLEDDITIDQSFVFSSEDNKGIDLNLNGKTIKIEVTDSKVGASMNIENSSLTVSNGKIEAINPGPTATANIVVLGGGELILDNVVYETNGSGIVPKIEENSNYTSGPKITVKNSKIIASVYGVATNNTYGNPWEITIENSEIATTYEDGDNTALLINQDGTLTVKNSTLQSGRQVAFIRTGNATFENVTFKVDKEFETPVTSWGNGNNVPNGVIVVGNPNYNAYYEADSSVTLKGDIKIEVPEGYKSDKILLMGRDSATIGGKVKRDTILDYSKANITGADSYTVDGNASAVVVNGTRATSTGEFNLTK